MDLISDIFTTSDGLTRFFIKAFAIVLSILFIIYALVMVRQIRVMQRTIQRTGGSTLRILSYLQVVIAFALLFIAFFVL